MTSPQTEATPGAGAHPAAGWTTGLPTDLATLDTDSLLTLYRLTLDLAPTPLLLCRPNGEIAMANARITQLFRYPPGALEGRRIEALVPEAARAHHPAQRAAFHHRPAKRKMGAGRDLFGVTADGHLLPVEVGLEPLPLGRETWVLTTVVDISERKGSERLLRDALDSSATAMILVDPDGRIVLLNRAACQLAGAEESHLLHAPIETLLPPAQRKSHAVYRTSFLAAAESRPMGGTQPLALLRADGREVPVEIALTPLPGRDGLRVMATVIDISDRLAHDRALEDRNKALAQLNEELSQFAYAASHDLKAPLSTISGLLELAQEDLRAGDLEEVAGALSQALETSRRNLRKVEAALTLARTGQSDSATTSVDLDQTIRDIWTDLTAGSAMAPDFTLSLDGSPTFVTESSALVAIIENLLSNAVRFRDPAKGRHHVQVIASCGPDGLTLAVGDNGPGFAPEARQSGPSVFRAYGAEAGHGLGLALVQKNIARLGGTFRIESNPQGSTLHVFLPLAKEYPA